MKLIAYKNNKVVSQFELDGGGASEGHEIFIGRSPDCHLVINDPQISREHAVLLFQKGKWILKRLTEMGTILINNQSVSEKVIVEEEDFNLGPYSIHVQDEPTASQPTPVVEEITNIVEAPVETGLENVELVHEPVQANEPETNIIAETPVEENNPVQEELVETNNEFESSVEAPAEDMNSLQNNDSVDIAAPIEPISDSEVSLPLEGQTSGDTFSENAPTNANIENNNGDGTQVIKAFSSYELQIFGEHAPYDRYVIEKDEIFIGRNQDKCQIVLDDHEVSGIHTVLRKTKFSLELEDLKSTNGTILNGARINKAELSEGDEFLIGSTSFTVKVKSELLDDEKDSLMPIEESAPVVQTISPQASTQAGATSAISQPDIFAGSPQKTNESFLKDPQKRKKLLYAVVGVLLIWMLMEEEEPPAPTTAAKPITEQAAAGTTPTSETKPETIGAPAAKQLSQEEREFVEATYNVAKAYIEKGEYAKGINELDKIKLIDENYKLTQTLYSYAKEGVNKLEELEKKEKREKLRKLREKEINELYEKAQVAYEKKEMNLAEQLINKIAEIDPENTKSQELKLSIEAFKKDLEEKKRIEDEKIAKREAMVSALRPGKNFYLKKDWYKAILKLEEFMGKDGMDEDLMKEGTSMLEESKASLSQITSPLLGKARSLKEGQDLKGAYETYNELLKYDPTSIEALNEMAAIRDELENRAKKIYREAIISESLSLFDEAKEKFQEVQQISPEDGEYYIKATDKLKEYLE